MSLAGAVGMLLIATASPPGPCSRCRPRQSLFAVTADAGAQPVAEPVPALEPQDRQLVAGAGTAR